MPYRIKHSKVVSCLIKKAKLLFLDSLLFSLIALPSSYLPTNSFSDIQSSVQSFIQKKENILPKLKPTNFKRASIVDTVVFNPLDLLNKVLDKITSDYSELVPPKVISTPTPQSTKLVSLTLRPVSQQSSTPIPKPLVLIIPQINNLDVVNSTIADLKIQIASLQNQIRNVPTIFNLPPTNTKGVGNTTLNPKNFESETATVSGTTTTAGLVVTSNAQINGTTKLNGITYTWPGSDGSASQLFQTNGSGTLSWVTVRQATSNSIDFDELVNSMTLDADLTISRAGYKIGVGSAPTTIFEVQGTASASYFLTGNTIQVGGFASAAYSRFGVGTATSAEIDTTNDLLIVGALEVDGNAFFDGKASVSGNFQTAGRFIFGDNGDVGSIDTSDWDISTTGTLTGISGITNDGAYTQTGTSNNTLTGKLFGINAEFQGTASASYFLTGNTLQVGGFASAAYSRFGTGTTTSSFLDGTSDLLITDALEVDGIVHFDGKASISDNFQTAGRFIFGDNGDTGEINTSDWDISSTGALTGIGAITSDGILTVDDRAEVQGTASASYLLTGNTIQVGGFSSAAYSRFGTATTGHTSDLDTINDLLISGALEVDGNTFFDGKASISDNFQTAGRFIFGDNGDTGEINTSDWDISSTGALTGISGITNDGVYTQTGTSNNTLTGKLFGINAEFQGTASASYFLTGNTLQVGGFASAAYSRFGTGTTTSSFLDGTSDLLITDALEVDGIVHFDGKASISDNFQTAGRFIFGDNGDTGEINTSDWDISSTGALTGIGAITSDGILTVDDRAEVQGTASASYLLTGNTIQVGGFSSAAYSRFGTATTGHTSDLDTINDLLISGALEVDGNTFFDGKASISGNFQTAGRFIFGDNGDTGEVNTSDWDISNTGNLSGIGTIAADGAYTQTGTGANTFSGSTTFSSTGLALLVSAGRVEFQGTASASYFLTGNTLQVGGFASVAYSRFGTSTTGHANYITGSNDLLVSGDLEVDGSISAQFASVSQMFIANNTASASAFFRSNGSGGTNQSNFSIGLGNGTERLNIFNNDNSPIVTIASTGNVGIGTTAPVNKLTISDGTAPYAYNSTFNDMIQLRANINDGGNLSITFGGNNNIFGVGYHEGNQAANEWIGFWNGFQDWAKGIILDGNGLVGINCTDPDALLELGGTGTGCNTGTGSSIAAGATAFTANSSQQWKQNIVTYNTSDILNKIKNTPARTFDWKPEFCPGGNCTDKLGFIAEEFFGVLGRGDDQHINGQDIMVAEWLGLQQIANVMDINNAPTSTPSLVIDVNGNVGIGTTGPLSKLDVRGIGYIGGGSALNAATLGLEVDPGNTGSITSEKFNVLSEGVTLTITGGFTNERYNYFAAPVISAASALTVTNAATVYIEGPPTAAGSAVITNPASLIVATGNVGIGTTNPSSNTLQVTGSAGKTVGGTAWSDLSDIRLKNVQGEVKGTALDTLMQLRPIKFKWNDTRRQLYGGSTDNLMYGFVAQEIMEVIPEFVKEGGDGYYWYNPSGFEAILTAAVQELKSMFDALAAKIEPIMAWFVDGKFMVQNDICVDDVCVTKEQFKQMLLNGRAGTTQSSSTEVESTPEASPEPSPTPEVTSEPTPEPTPAPTPAPTPEPTLEPTPEPSESSVPEELVQDE